MKVRLAACLAMAAPFSLPAQALVVRHDVDERVFLELARNFPATATFHRASAPDHMEAMGTLIHPRWILTAAHVAETLRPGDLAEIGGVRIRIEAIVLAPGWNGFQKREDYQKDIALVRLTGAATGVAPARIYERSAEAGCIATFAGRGSYGTGLTGPSSYGSSLRAATNRVEKAEGSYLQFRFDAPGDPAVTAWEGISGEGDSGGPAYCTWHGVTYLVGVSSSQDARPTGRKIGHYGVLEYYSRVSAFAAWIRATLASTEAGNRS